MVSHHDHHRHSAYLLAHVDAPGFSQSQQRRIGDLVLGQRGGLRKVEPQLASETFAWQVLCLRLAVIKCHARGEADPQGAEPARARPRRRAGPRRGLGRGQPAHAVPAAGGGRDLGPQRAAARWCCAAASLDAGSRPRTHRVQHHLQLRLRVRARAATTRRPCAPPRPAPGPTAGRRRPGPAWAGGRPPAPARGLRASARRAAGPPTSASGASAGSVLNLRSSAAAVCCARRAGLTSTRALAGSWRFSQAAMRCAWRSPLGVSARSRSSCASSRVRRASAWRHRMRSIVAVRVVRNSAASAPAAR